MPRKAQRVDLLLEIKTAIASNSTSGRVIPPAPVYSEAVQRKFMQLAATLPEPISSHRNALWLALNAPRRIAANVAQKQLLANAIGASRPGMMKLMQIIERGPAKNETLEEWLRVNPAAQMLTPEEIRLKYFAATGDAIRDESTVRKALGRIHRSAGGKSLRRRR